MAHVCFADIVPLVPLPSPPSAPAMMARYNRCRALSPRPLHSRSLPTRRRAEVVGTAARGAATQRRARRHGGAWRRRGGGGGGGALLPTRRLLPVHTDQLRQSLSRRGRTRRRRGRRGTGRQAGGGVRTFALTKRRVGVPRDRSLDVALRRRASSAVSAHKLGSGEADAAKQSSPHGIN